MIYPNPKIAARGLAVLLMFGSCNRERCAEEEALEEEAANDERFRDAAEHQVGI
jgi:hypothetical protein